MQNLSFALPTLGTAAMSAADQRDILLNQATASIISDYLGHMNAAIAKGVVPNLQFITQAQLITLIDNVQGALRAI